MNVFVQLAGLAFAALAAFYARGAVRQARLQRVEDGWRNLATAVYEIQRAAERVVTLDRAYEGARDLVRQADNPRVGTHRGWTPGLSCPGSTAGGECPRYHGPVGQQIVFRDNPATAACRASSRAQSEGSVVMITTRVAGARLCSTRATRTPESSARSRRPRTPPRPATRAHPRNRAQPTANGKASTGALVPPWPRHQFGPGVTVCQPRRSRK